MKETLIVNLFAGPGALKSTIAAGVFTLLKLHGLDCDCPHEFPKDLIWENNYEALNDQAFIFGNQSHRLWRVNKKVDVVLIDSPILFSLIYRQDTIGPKFKECVIETFNKYNNLNIVLERNSDYNYEDNGREQNYKEALEIDKKILKVLNDYGIPYLTFIADYLTINNLTKLILERFNKELKFKLEE